MRNDEARVGMRVAVGNPPIAAGVIVAVGETSSAYAATVGACVTVRRDDGSQFATNATALIAAGAA